MNSTHATCVFKGVYRIIYMPWFHGDTEIRDFSTGSTEDQDWGETIWSTIEVDTRNLSKPYKCCLVGLSGGIAHCQTLKLTSSGSMLRLEWMFAMLEILLVKSLMWKSKDRLNKPEKLDQSEWWAGFFCKWHRKTSALQLQMLLNLMFWYVLIVVVCQL